MQLPESASGAKTPLRDAADAEALVVATIQKHADALLRVARRYSICADDAADAYQRALEIFLRYSTTLEAEHAHRWLFRVVVNESHSVREQRQRILGHEDVDFDLIEARDAPSPEDRALSFDTVARSAEALQRLKPHEVRALWMRASGRSYAEIASECGWSYTKVNRCLTEGRRSFLSHYSAIEAGDECARWAPLLSALIDGEATAAQLAELRPHLRNCSACRADLRTLHRSTAALTAVFPVSLVAGATVSGGDTAGWLARLHDLVAAHVHERVVGSMLKLQAAADVVSAGKVAAVAASAAALAGGGIAVAENSEPGSHKARAAHHAAPRVASITRVAARVAPIAEAPPSPASSAAAAPRSHPEPAHAGRARDFDIAASPEQAAPTPTETAPSKSAAQEFAP